MLELRWIRHVRVLAREGNFARAAAALGISQPALSRSIAAFEASLGERLFDRTSQGVEPTAAGRLVIERGGDVLDGALGLEREIKRLRGLEIGELRVGTGVYPAEVSVGTAIGRLAVAHPGLRVDVRVGDARDIAIQLLERRIDLAVFDLSIADGERMLATEALPEHPATFFCRPGHPLADGKEPATIERVLSFPFAGPRMSPRAAWTFRELARSGSMDRDTGEFVPPILATSLPMVRRIVLASDAIGISPIAMLAEDLHARRVVALPVDLPWLHTAYGVAHHREHPLSTAGEAFVGVLRSVEAEIAAARATVESTPARPPVRSTPAASAPATSTAPGPRGRARAAKPRG